MFFDVYTHSYLISLFIFIFCHLYSFSYVRAAKGGDSVSYVSPIFSGGANLVPYRFGSSAVTFHAFPTAFILLLSTSHFSRGVGGREGETVVD
jgi:hypothetical protein